MSYRKNIESEILVHTGWLVDPNSNRGGRKDAVGGFLGPQQPGKDGTGSSRGGRRDAVGGIPEPQRLGRRGTKGRVSKRRRGTEGRVSKRRTGVIGGFEFQ
jgi:hypothetical protein